MSYSNPVYVSYDLLVTTTDAAATHNMRGPKGRVGKLIDVIARCTTTHVLGSTPTALKVGLSGTVDAYATFLPAAQTAPDSQTLTDLPGASAIVDVVIPANTEVLLTTVANATGSPAGVFTYTVVIAWF